MSKTDDGAAERRLLDDLPGEITREILAGDYQDPIWYAGRLGLSVQDALDATPAQLAELRALAGLSDGNGNGSVNGSTNGNANGRTNGNGNGPVLTRRDRRPADPD